MLHRARCSVNDRWQLQYHMYECPIKIVFRKQVTLLSSQISFTELNQTTIITFTTIYHVTQFNESSLYNPSK